MNSKMNNITLAYLTCKYIIISLISLYKVFEEEMSINIWIDNILFQSVCVRVVLNHILGTNL